MAHMDDNEMKGKSQITAEVVSKPTLEEMHVHLDALWTAYLNHLDAYTSSQSLLQKHMSAGFLSLARANFNSRDRIRRYGQDYYHERAVATTRVTISIEDRTRKPTLGVAQWRPPSTESDLESESAVEVEKTGDEVVDVKQIPSPPRTPEPQHERHHNETNADAAATEKVTRLPLQADPLKWFEFVPQALRSAHANFRAVVDEAVADAANAARGMRSIEVEIRRLRKEIRKAEKDVTVRH